MITTEADFAALMSASADEPEALHWVCNHCWPPGTPGGTAVAVCGHQTKTGPLARKPCGQHLCAKCVVIYDASPLPCGHP